MGEGGQNSENNEPGQDPVKRVRKSLGQRAAEWGHRTEYAVDKTFADPELDGKKPSWFGGLRKASRKEDKREHTDRWVDTDVGPIRMQIKSSDKGVKDAQDSLGEGWSDEIAFVVARPDLSHQTILDRCLAAVGRIREARLKAKDQE